MLTISANRHESSFLIGLCTLAISTGLVVSTTRAQDASPDAYSPIAHGTATTAASPKKLTAVHPATLPQTAQKPASQKSTAQRPAATNSGKPYFVEFRSRSAYNYGHTFLVHGRVGQTITQKDVVGLHPISESPVPWMIGHVVPVISETGASDGDTEEIYVTARYRVLLSEPEYQKVAAFMRRLQASSPVWHALLYNCNAFVADIAKFMGLRTPHSTVLLYPKDFITELRDLNTEPKRAAGAARPAPASAE